MSCIIYPNNSHWQPAEPGFRDCDVCMWTKYWLEQCLNPLCVFWHSMEAMKWRMSAESEKSRTPDTTQDNKSALSTLGRCIAHWGAGVCVCMCDNLSVQAVLSLYVCMCAWNGTLLQSSMGAHWFPLSDPSDPMGAQCFSLTWLFPSHTQTHTHLSSIVVKICLQPPIDTTKKGPRGARVSPYSLTPCLTSIKWTATSQTHLSVKSNFLPAYKHNTD